MSVTLKLCIKINPNKFKMRIKVLFFLLFVGLTSNYSQWECRSHLAANLQPLYSGSKINWATEISGSVGYITSDPISTSMLFLGLDYSSNHHQLYFEGGLKYWYRKDLDKEFNYSKYLLGLRESSYSYISPSFDLKLGLQQFSAHDYFLVNERGIGAHINKKLGGMNLSFNAASVTKSFARNGIFCANCFIYDITSTRYLPLGNYLGETNFAALTLSGKKGKKTGKTPLEDVAEKSGDEFSEFDEFESTDDIKEKNSLILESYGAVVYSEFGRSYPNQMLNAGLFGELSFWKAFTFKAEGLFQSYSENNALVYFLKAERILYWKSGNILTFNLVYLDKYDLNEVSLVVPRFSNLFLGEVYRMDLVDMPLINASMKYQFLQNKLSFKLQYSSKLDEERLKELDFSVGKFLVNNHLRLTLLTGAMHSSEIDGVTGVGRVEMRLFF
jgi:hypothetical protein